jgi:hypothetical protein
MGPQRRHPTLDHLRTVSVFNYVSLRRLFASLLTAHPFAGSSVSNRLRRNFRALAESNSETYNSAGYEYVKMDVYVPILDLPQARRHRPTSLSNVAIQGSFRFERRDYLGVYADLLASFQGAQLVSLHLPETFLIFYLQRIREPGDTYPSPRLIQSTKLTPAHLSRPFSSI